MDKLSNNKNSIFGLTPTRAESRIVIQPVPWEVTTSYGGGTSGGPDAIRLASPQIDLFDLDVGLAYEAGYYLEDISPNLTTENIILKNIAQDVIFHWDEFGEVKPAFKSKIDAVNTGTSAMVKSVYENSLKIISEGKIPAVLGGDHSTPLGLIQALGENLKGDFGILHIDAHADLRLAYHGFTHSHASIMRNVMLLKTPPKKLVQVAIRDFCDEEYQFIQSQKGKIHTYFDRENKRKLFDGTSWTNICTEIIENLPKNVYVSFDIDGLSPEFCPHTGTPVPGGMSFDQAIQLLYVLGTSGKRIVGFDLNEVAPGPDTEWDANVGARILFKLCGWSVRTNN
jgi:agmatinase